MKESVKTGFPKTEDIWRLINWWSWKHYGERRHCSWETVSQVDYMFSYLFWNDKILFLNQHIDHFLQQTNFEMIVAIAEIAHNIWAICPFTTMISTLLNYHTIIIRYFLCFVLDHFNVVCCRFIVCGNGLIMSTIPIEDEYNRSY